MYLVIHTSKGEPTIVAVTPDRNAHDRYKLVESPSYGFKICLNWSYMAISAAFLTEYLKTLAL